MKVTTVNCALKQISQLWQLISKDKKYFDNLLLSLENSLLSKMVVSGCFEFITSNGISSMTETDMLVHYNEGNISGCLWFNHISYTTVFN